MAATRTERDSMGEMEVPADALYGASTQRAVLNFPISGYRFGRRFIRALGLIKHAAATANQKLGRLEVPLANAVQAAAREVIDGEHDAQFVVDIYQTGSGTSTNMNANEVIARRASQLLENRTVHPNDHVNMGQSSNDVIPTAMHVAMVESFAGDLQPALEKLHTSLAAKATAFDALVKIGRTHLQDATPIRLGQEFSGYAHQARQSQRCVGEVLDMLRALPIGGTAVGTGLNTHPDFARRVCQVLNEELRETFRETENHFAAQHAKDTIVMASGVLRTVAVSLTKIANDIRWLGSGPRCGLGELRLPATQPGSSIMPGKVNPVICESVLQVCAQVVGNDAAVAHAAALLGNLDLHVGMPVIAHNALESIRLLSNVSRVFAERCIEGLEADEERCASLIEQSLAMCTSLAPRIGYDRAAALAKEAYATGRTVRELATEQGLLDPAELNHLLDPKSMTTPQA